MMETGFSIYVYQLSMKDVKATETVFLQSLRPTRAMFMEFSATGQWGRPCCHVSCRPDLQDLGFLL